MEEYSIYFERYGYFSLFFVVALLVPAGMLFGSFLFKVIGIRKNNPTPVKTDIYEAGIRTFSSRWSGFNFRYYTFAMMFLIFDVEVIFLFPWAASLIKPEDEEGYVKEVRLSDLEKPGDDDIIDKLLNDFELKNLGIEKQEIIKKIEECGRLAAEKFSKIK